MSTNLVPLYGPLYGSFYFAAVVSTAFYGVTCMQTFFYYVHYENDPFRVKILVAIMWALNTIHEALSVSGVYKFILAGLVNPLKLSFTAGNTERILLYLLTVLVAVPTQGFFVYRIYTFSGKNIVAPLVWVVLALVGLVCTIILVGKSLYSVNAGLNVVEPSVLHMRLNEFLATICFSLAAAVDVLIAIFMTFLLVRERRATGFARTAHILQRLTMFAVNTGIWTAMFALLSIILMLLFPKSGLYVVFAIPLCPIYCNVLLANLNARGYFRDEATTYHVDIELFGTSPSVPVSDSAKGKK